jgi:DNA-binding NarL/FixJ family response regulator
MYDRMTSSRVRVLVADDYEPWCRFVLSTFQSEPTLEVIFQASDGLQAVQKAEELQPDLILLDIGLPKLSGIQAARTIRELFPKIKILFASVHRHSDIVEAALRTGAEGYIVKTDAATELLPAIEAILHGERFVSPSLGIKNGVRNTDPEVPGAGSQRRIEAPLPPQNIRVRHEVEFYPNDVAFVDGFSRVIEAALRTEAAVIVNATESHRAAILERLRGNGVEIDAAIQDGTYISLAADDAVAAIMVNDMPDPARCAARAREVITRAAETVKRKHARVAICGECAPLLLEAGNPEAAIRLEHLWDEITRQYEADTLCGYLWSSFPEHESDPVFRRICAEHSAVHGRHLGY